ncbi:MAG: hypothetical protein LBO73_01410, partial [Holosporaceae bacterium]|nr:hypothetical protein [Holosporaceae bacterium]
MKTIRRKIKLRAILRIAAAVLVFFVGAEAFGRSEVKVVSSVEEAKPAFGGNSVSVVFGSDDNYAMYLTVALRSLIDNSSRNRKYDVWILDGGISEDKR